MKLPAKFKKKIIWSGFRATLNNWKFKVAPESAPQNFFLTLQRFILAFWSLLCEFVFQIWATKTKILAVFARLPCCHGNLLRHKKDCILLSNNWCFTWYHNCCYVIKCCGVNPSNNKASWKCWNEHRTLPKSAPGILLRYRYNMSLTNPINQEKTHEIQMADLSDLPLTNHRASTWVDISIQSRTTHFQAWMKGCIVRSWLSSLTSRHTKCHATSVRTHTS